jgi:hypothetical protein
MLWLELYCVDIAVHCMVKGVPTSNLINTLLHEQVSSEFDYIQVSCNSHLDAVDGLFCLEQPAEEIKTVLLMNCFADSKVWLCLALVAWL